MLAFKIEIEGQPTIIAGAADWSILSMHVSAARGSGAGKTGSDLGYSVGGLSTADERGIAHHFRWPRGPLGVGSRMAITVVETETADVPLKRYRADGEVQESPFTEEEEREMRRQDYLELKKEFEREPSAQSTAAQPAAA